MHIPLTTDLTDGNLVRMKFTYDPETGLIGEAEFRKSPNYDDRPDNMAPEVLIIHSISLPPGEFGGSGIDELFTNCLDPDAHPYYREIGDMKVSSHLLIRRSGELVQYVPLFHRAWHAGQSQCEGRERVNDFSIGIELEGCDDREFEPIQYNTLVEITQSLMRAFPAIRPDRIYGHSDIAPGRKTDPGPFFDWPGYRTRIA